MGKDSAARIELGRSFHQLRTVNEKVSESDFVPLTFVKSYFRFGMVQ